MRRRRDRSPRLLGPSLTWAYLCFAATFRGPRERFWQRMTLTGFSLGALALAGDARLRHLRLRPADVAGGVAVAGGLYGVFWVGDRVARAVLPAGGQEIAEIYSLREHRPALEIAARLALVVGPAEELYWRGLVQRGLEPRLGKAGAAAAGTALYAGAHLVTGNPTLIAAAAAAGAGWSALAALDLSPPALVVSHSLWDVFILLVRPTQSQPPPAA